MIQPPRILLIGVLTIIIIFSGLFSLPWFSFIQPFFALNFYFWFVLFCLTVVSLLVSIPYSFFNYNTFRALLKVPLGFVLMFVSLIKIKGANTTFLHTTHSHVDDKKNQK